MCQKPDSMKSYSKMDYLKGNPERKPQIRLHLRFGTSLAFLTRPSEKQTVTAV